MSKKVHETSIEESNLLIFTTGGGTSEYIEMSLARLIEEFEEGSESLRQAICKDNFDNVKTLDKVVSERLEKILSESPIDEPDRLLLTRFLLCQHVTTGSGSPLGRQIEHKILDLVSNGA